MQMCTSHRSRHKISFGSATSVASRPCRTHSSKPCNNRRSNRLRDTDYLQQEPQQDPNSHDNTVAGPGLRDNVATALTVVTRNAAANDGDSSGGSSDANTIASNTPIIPPALVLRGQYDFVSESYSLGKWGDSLLNSHVILRNA
jgi:hypothetical protein